MQKDLTDIERLQREIQFLRAAEHESQRLFEAEVAGTLACKRGFSQYLNPFDRSDLDAWTRWAVGWSNESESMRGQNVIHAAMACVPAILERMRLGGATQEERALIATLEELQAAHSQADPASYEDVVALLP